MYTYLIGQHNVAFSQRYHLQSKTYQKKKNREENMFVNWSICEYVSFFVILNFQYCS